jgi:hypothetical protein
VARPGPGHTVRIDTETSDNPTTGGTPGTGVLALSIATIVLVAILVIV